MRSHQEEVETLKRNHQSDRQTLEQQQTLQLRAIDDERCMVNLAMEQQYIVILYRA